MRADDDDYVVCSQSWRLPRSPRQASWQLFDATVSPTSAQTPTVRRARRINRERVVYQPFYFFSLCFLFYKALCRLLKFHSALAAGLQQGASSETRECFTVCAPRLSRTPSRVIWNANDGVYLGLPTPVPPGLCVVSG